MLAEDIWRLDNSKILSACGEDQPIVFVEKLNNAMRLTALSRAAIALGLTPDLTLADARARVPELIALDRDHQAEARLLARVVAVCVRYTPMAAAEPPDGAILDISGCAHGFGGEAGLKSDLGQRLDASGITAFCALGDTPEQARALARFGHKAKDLLGLPVEALEADPAVTLALRRFAEPIARIEDALACLEELGHQVAQTLLERHEGGRRFVARFFRSDGAILPLEVATGHPTRDPALLIRLFRERIDTLSDPIDPGFGFDMIRLDVGQCEALVARQDDHLAPSRHVEDLAELIDRLSVRLGARRVHRVRPENTHIPECATTACAPAHAPTWETAPEGEPPMRPLRLFDPPQPVGAVMSEVPDGPPMRFTWRGKSHGVTRWEGPERIAAEWWRRRDRGGRPRDYYRVEDESGHRFWLFRHGLHENGGAQPDWYLHGLFA